MSDPYALPVTGQSLPGSATLINSLLDGARADADSDSRPAGDASVSTDYYPHRVIFIRNTTQFQIPDDQPIPIGKPSGSGDFYNGQVVFPIVSYVPGWATYARPLKRLPPGCAGPAVILGWLGPGRRGANYVYGGQAWRRTQPQRAYGGTTFTGLAYVQAARQDFPRAASTVGRQAWFGELFGLNYSGSPEARFPGMESLGYRNFPFYGTTLELRNPADQHGWWNASVELRTYHNYSIWGGTNNFFSPPAVQTFRQSEYGGQNQIWLEPICWHPAIVGFNAATNAYSGNFNFDPLVTGTAFNPNGGVPPRPISQTFSIPVNFSSKNLWQKGESEANAMARSALYRFNVSGSLVSGWNITNTVPPEAFAVPGPEVVQIFETDRDDAIRSDGSVIPPVITPGPSPSNLGSLGPDVFGPIGLSPAQAPKTQGSNLVRRISAGFGSVRGSAETQLAGCTQAASGSFSSGPVSGSAALVAADSSLAASGSYSSGPVTGSVSLTAANATLSAGATVSGFGGGGA